MKKTFLSFVLCIAMICAVSGQAFAAAFTDVESGKWYAEGINYCSSKGIIKGYKDGSFKPNNSITRAELAAICSTGLELQDKAENTFSDVKDDAWYAPYVLACVEAGIISGYGNGKFGPNDRVTREQAALIASNIFDIPLYAGHSEFADESSISSWAQNGVLTMSRAGLVSGKGNNRFCPKDNVTRAEVAVVIHAAHKKGIGIGRSDFSQTAVGRIDSTRYCSFTYEAEVSGVYEIEFTKIESPRNIITVKVQDSRGNSIATQKIGTIGNNTVTTLTARMQKGSLYKIVVEGDQPNRFEFVLLYPDEET